MTNFQAYINKLAADIPPEFLANIKKNKGEDDDKKDDKMCRKCDKNKDECKCKDDGDMPCEEKEAYIRGYNTVLKVAFCL